jgi:hypothetical protein
MRQMKFIRDLSKKSKPIAESLSYEDALLARLEKEADRAANIDKIDTVTLDVPLLIRVFELVREDVKTDMDLHNLVERMISIKDKGVLTMDDYETISSAQASADTGQMPKSTDESIDMSMLKMLAGIRK